MSMPFIKPDVWYWQYEVIRKITGRQTWTEIRAIFGYMRRNYDSGVFGAFEVPGERTRRAIAAAESRLVERMVIPPMKVA